LSADQVQVKHSSFVQGGLCAELKVWKRTRKCGSTTQLGLESGPEFRELTTLSVVASSTHSALRPAAAAVAAAAL